MQEEDNAGYCGGRQIVNTAALPVLLQETDKIEPSPAIFRSTKAKECALTRAVVLRRQAP